MADDFKHFNQYNSPESVNWSLEAGYSTIDTETYPRRVPSLGFENALVIMLVLHKEDMDYTCSLKSPGFKFILHTPGELPEVSKESFKVLLEQEVSVIVRPSIMTTSESLRRYSAKTRKCFFNYERNLKFFKLYSKYHCDQECLANFTLGEWN